MKVFVTGATGFIGSVLARELLNQGFEVRCLVREESNTANIKDLDLEFVPGNIQDYDSVRKGLKGCNHVYHLAALYTNWYPNPSILYNINVKGTRNVLQACLDEGVEKVVYTSSTAALGAHGKEPADESATFNTFDTNDHYCISKYQAEGVAIEFAQKGFPVVIVNPSAPVGPYDIKPTPTGQLIINIVLKKYPGYVEGGINIVDVFDVARGHILAMEKGKPGEKYILANRNITIGEFMKMVAQIAGVKPPLFRIPKRLAVLSAYMYEGIARITGSPPLTTASWVKLGSYYSWWRVDKAIRELGFPQTDVEESIKKAIQWFHENGMI
jgi:dihydroflavonol-4-reductase